MKRKAADVPGIIRTIALFFLDKAVDWLVPQYAWLGYAFTWLFAASLVIWLVGLPPIAQRVVSQRRKHPIVSPILVFILCGTAGVVCFRFWPRSAPAASTSSATPALAPPAPALKPTALFAEYGISGIPLSVPPRSTLYVLRVSPSRNAISGFVTSRNDSDSSGAWPGKGPEIKPDMATRVTLVNRGDVSLLKVALDFRLNFKKPGSQGGSAATDPVVRVKRHRVEIPGLAPNESFTFFLVNTSALHAYIDYPKEVTAQVYGEGSRRTIEVQRSSPSLIDEVTPVFPLAPTSNVWPGFPEDPVK